jgi:periplasmic divalent cation tolerance protein
MELIAVLTTVGSMEEARRLARAIVERKLAACAQLSLIESFYNWKGSLQHEPEVRVLFKATKQNYQVLEAAIVELHSYELPAIHAIELTAVYEPYAQWITESTAT